MPLGGSGYSVLGESIFNGTGGSICAEFATTLDAEAIFKARQKKTLPILKVLFQWLDAQYDHVLPESSIGKAIKYNLKRKDALMAYASDGKLQIDNNPVENLIRPLALGRKNYLFAGSHDAAQRSAIFYSLFATCKLNNIEPFSWLKNVLTIIKDHPVNRIEELLPVEGYRPGGGQFTGRLHLEHIMPRGTRSTRRLMVGPVEPQGKATQTTILLHKLRHLQLRTIFGYDIEQCSGK